MDPVSTADGNGIPVRQGLGRDRRVETVDTAKQ